MPFFRAVGAESAPRGPDHAHGDLVPTLDQLVSVQALSYDEGPARGAPLIVVRNPAGISFDVLSDRALDIGWADACGAPLAWRSPVGPVASSRFEPARSGWGRTFGGGLLSTCGLSSTGAPSTVEGTEYGLHGRIGNTPGQNIRAQLWTDAGGEVWVEIEGDVLESGLGSPDLLLHRVIRASTSRAVMQVVDRVTNLGASVAGHMFRHHVNLGYPLVGYGSVLSGNMKPEGRRDPPPKPGSESGDGAWSLPHLPWKVDPSGQPVAEDVLYFRPPAGLPARSRITAVDGSWLEVEFDPRQWPWFVVWRDASPRTNVLGLEPSTSRDGGRAAAERDREVVWMQPDESRDYRTVIRAGTGDGPRR